MLLSARHVAGDVSNRAHFYIPLVNRPRRSNTERLGACYVCSTRPSSRPYCCHNGAGLMILSRFCCRGFS
ncbi:hypothetical protein RR11_789 [Ruegeria sp. R11]|nr:hypothetical protein RR11_789 [Ruegeria sp. R11]